MKSTMRNQFTGVIKSVDVAPVTAQVVIALSAGPEIVATMTRSSAERLKLKSGVPAIALIKAPSIALVTDLGGYVLSARNQFAGTVSQVERGSVNSKVVLSVPGGIAFTCSVTNDAVEELGLKPGSAATAVFKAYSVMVAVKPST
ncbi:MAG TPA: TOBE domain-containing protein [Burkholderiaceae bacterium]|jgi:molybdate transport system regulatory protein|nr:TOBE domain-containing protein [Burkholderiaceae bacterium]